MLTQGEAWFVRIPDRASITVKLIQTLVSNAEGCDCDRLFRSLVFTKDEGCWYAGHSFRQLTFKASCVGKDRAAAAACNRKILRGGGGGGDYVSVMQCGWGIRKTGKLKLMARKRVG